jgi:calcineurin-like phosphoesterase family protein
MIFFTSDLHLNHANIIKFCNRPFSCVSEMNNTLINNWNSKVGKYDHTFILGDFAFSNAKMFLSQLNGTKSLIIGDHDKQYDNLYPSYPFPPSFLEILERKRHTTPLFVKNLFNQYNVESISLCHWKMQVWRKSHYNCWHLFGHSHSRLPSTGKSHDVGVDNNDYFPLSLVDVVNIMKNKPDNPNKVKKEKDNG